MNSSSSIAREIANHFVDARRRALALTAYPGSVPTSLDDAYQIQDIAIGLWGQVIGGWKVARIPPHLEKGLGTDRLAGPIFEQCIQKVTAGAPTNISVFSGGFAAIEAEFIAVIGEDAPVSQRTWSAEETRGMISDLRIGFEIAGSPLATINELGPAAVVSDFGNNNGLIVGPSVKDWRRRSLESMRSATQIEGEVVGEGGAHNLSGGYIRSVQFLLELTAHRGLPLRAGDFIATGQTTGVHNIAAGQTATADFENDGRFNIKAFAAKPVLQVGLSR